MQESFFQNKQMRILGALVLTMFIVALGSYASLNFKKISFLNPAPASIAVTGEGEVFAVPDIGQFSFSVLAEENDAAKAQESSGTKINNILGYLSEQGIDDKDIKTTNYNLSPKYKWVPRTDCGEVSLYRNCGNERVQDGFQVTQTVSVKVRDTGTAGAVIAGVGERGATNISSLDFTIDDADLLRADARKEAIADAQEKAKILAKQLGVNIIRLASYREGGSYYQPRYENKVMAYDLAEADGFGGAEMPVGEESMKVQVNVVYIVE